MKGYGKVCIRTVGGGRQENRIGPVRQASVWAAGIASQRGSNEVVVIPSCAACTLCSFPLPVSGSLLIPPRRRRAPTTQQDRKHSPLRLVSLTTTLFLPRPRRPVLRANQSLPRANTHLLLKLPWLVSYGLRFRTESHLLAGRLPPHPVGATLVPHTPSALPPTPLYEERKAYRGIVFQIID